MEAEEAEAAQEQVAVVTVLERVLEAAATAAEEAAQAERLAEAAAAVVRRSLWRRLAVP